MRIAILSNSLPAATRIYSQVAVAPDRDVHVLIFLDPDRSWLFHLAKQTALLVLRRRRLASLRSLRRGRVRLIRKAPEHPETVALLAKMQFDVGLHNLGVIYRERTIKAFRLGILNAHIGLLPEYRGRCVMEWSLIQGDPTGITVFFIDSGIDTGSPIVLREEVDISHCKSIGEAKEYLFSLDSVFYHRALELLQSELTAGQMNDRAGGRRFFVMSRLFKKAAAQRLENMKWQTKIRNN